MRLFKRGGDLGTVDFNNPAEGSADPAAAMAQRNDLIARWISDATGASLESAADDLPRLLGLSFGRARLSGQLSEARPHEDLSLSYRLAVPQSLALGLTAGAAFGLAAAAASVVARRASGAHTRSAIAVGVGALLAAAGGVATLMVYALVLPAASCPWPG